MMRTPVLASRLVVAFLASVVAMSSLTACVAAPETTDSVLPSGQKPLPDQPSSEVGTGEQGIDDGQITWVEVLDTDNARISKVHHVDSETGLDTIDILDE